MTEFTSGFIKALKKLNTNGSLIRTLIYTIGHIIIAVTCVMVITGSTLQEALTDAFMEPLLNSVWFFALDRFWVIKVIKNQH